jgi:hypothetical protein
MCFMFFVSLDHVKWISSGSFFRLEISLRTGEFNALVHIFIVLGSKLDSWVTQQQEQNIKLD